jgi:glutamate--cysteine ligase catalytic subunit
MTDFENAALVTFIVLLTRAIMTYNLNLLIPISNVRYDCLEFNINLYK